MCAVYDNISFRGASIIDIKCNEIFPEACNLDKVEHLYSQSDLSHLSVFGCMEVPPPPPIISPLPYNEYKNSLT